MKTKTLALISGLVGLIGGTILLLSNIFFVPFSAPLGDFGLNLLGAVIKLAALGLGIASLAYYKGQSIFRLFVSLKGRGEEIFFAFFLVEKIVLMETFFLTFFFLVLK